MSTGFVGVGVEIPRNRVGSVRNGCPRSVCDRRVGVVMFAKRVRRQGGKGDKRTDAEGRGTPSEGKEGLGEEGMFEVDGIIEKGDKEDIVEEFEFQGPLAPKSYAKSDEGAMASAARRRRKKRNLKKSGKKVNGDRSDDKMRETKDETNEIIVKVFFVRVICLTNHVLVYFWPVRLWCGGSHHSLVDILKKIWERTKFLWRCPLVSTPTSVN